MRLYSKVAFVFQHHDSVAQERVTIKCNEIKDVPDWVKKDKTFIDGKAAGLIEVLENREQELKAELKATEKPKTEAKGPKADVKAPKDEKKEG